jgi:LacI family transcriptional regulator
MSVSAKGNNRPRVVLLFDSSHAFGRGALLGIAHYVREHGPWTIFLQERTDALHAGWLRHWRGEGLIVEIENRSMAHTIHQLGLPVVALRYSATDIPFPTVRIDDAAVARLAAEHLFERGFRHFAYCGLAGAEYSALRGAAFRKHISRTNHSCQAYEDRDRFGRKPKPVRAEPKPNFSAQMARWLRRLPKPVGILACNDVRGQQTLNACQAAGLMVPDEVAVLGVDNDDILCELSEPPLSSVAPNYHRMGYEAAALLDRMMRKEIPAPLRQPLVIEPTGVVTRRSTEVLAIPDPHIASAVRFIREHACDGIDVRDVLRVVPLSRSALERRFSTFLHHSPKTEILRVRLKHARALLVDTDYSMALVAEKLGLKHAEYFNVIFKKQMGITPGQFRNQSRQADTTFKEAVTNAGSLQPRP